MIFYREVTRWSPEVLVIVLISSALIQTCLIFALVIYRVRKMEASTNKVLKALEDELEIVELCDEVNSPAKIYSKS